MKSPHDNVLRQDADLVRAPKRDEPSAVTLAADAEDHRIAALAALAITIHILETALPMPLPGVKPGLANVVTVCALLLYGWRVAAWVAGLRILVGSLLLGSFLSPGFVLSVSGGTASLVSMIAARRLIPGLSAIGHSVIAAVTHMSAQFLVAYWLFIPHSGLLHLLPVMLTAALVFGLVSGTVAKHAIAHYGEV